MDAEQLQSSLAGFYAEANPMLHELTVSGVLRTVSMVESLDVAVSQAAGVLKGIGSGGYRPPPPEVVVVIGGPGSARSTVGARVAAELGCACLDMATLPMEALEAGTACGGQVRVRAPSSDGGRGEACTRLAPPPLQDQSIAHPPAHSPSRPPALRGPRARERRGYAERRGLRPVCSALAPSALWGGRLRSFTCTLPSVRVHLHLLGLRRRRR